MPERLDARPCSTMRFASESSKRQKSIAGLMPENCEAENEEGVVKDIISSYLPEDGKFPKGNAGETVENGGTFDRASRRRKEKEIARRIFRSSLDWKNAR